MKQRIELLLLAIWLMAAPAAAQTVGGEIRRPKKTGTTTSTSTQRNSSGRKQNDQKGSGKKTSGTSSSSSRNDILKKINDNMVFVKGGTFLMGATPNMASDADEQEKPAHQVQLSAFYINKYEVTQEEWEAVMGTNPSEQKGDRLPVVKVSWDDCQAFIKKLNALTGKHYRLPTEAEWEYAARDGELQSGYKYAGNNGLGNVAWYRDNSDDELHEVGTCHANTLGLYDMSGNVYEWCNDVPRWYTDKKEVNPQGGSKDHEKIGKYRVVRGGSFVTDAKKCRVSYRLWTTSTNTSFIDVGLRLACDSEAASMEKNSILQNLMNNMVTVEGGTFNMGSDKYDTSEMPVHQVTLSTFGIGKYEVTQEEWQMVMGSNPTTTKNRGARVPVTNVTWNDCQKFIQKLNAMTGKHFRLPTEAEWEYAARGGKNGGRHVYAGSDKLDDVGWYKDNAEHASQVGMKAPNELGLYDMTGNVFEWVNDWYAPYQNTKQNNPKGPATGSDRLIKGGSFQNVEKYLHVTNRQFHLMPDQCSWSLGLRLAW